MTGADDEQTVEMAFTEFRSIGRPYVAAPGVGDIAVRTRRRRVVRHSTLACLGVVLVAGAALSGATLVQRPANPPTVAGPPVTPSGTAAATSPAGSAAPSPPGNVPSATPSATKGSPATTAPQGDTSNRSPTSTAAISISASYLVFGPADGDVREGGLIVRVDNAGPAATGLAITVTTPSGISVDGPGGGGCPLKGSAGTYRCQRVALGAGETATLRFDFTAPAGELPPAPADRRAVSVRSTTATETDKSDNQVTYLIRTDV